MIPSGDSSATGALQPSLPIRERSLEQQLVPKAGWLDSLLTVGEVFLPTIAKGVILRRPSMVALASYLDLDRRAIRRMQRVRGLYGTGPLRLRIPGRNVVLLLDPEDVHRVLHESPYPFTSDAREKRAVLSHFEPKNVLISRGPDHADRRRFHEQALDSSYAHHRFAEAFEKVIRDEIHWLCTHTKKGELRWDDFSAAWSRIVRRIVFGDSAIEDQRISAIMTELRGTANWAFLRAPKFLLREELFARIRAYLKRRPSNSLAVAAAESYITERTAPEQQIPQWLFAFDPAGMTTFRALALLSANSRAARPSEAYLRATVLETLRLWPTTPIILRETTEDTWWSNGMVPAGSSVVTYAPFFHRDSERFEFADRFAPELWTKEEDGNRERALVPFSEGPDACPGRNLVLFAATTALNAFLREGRMRLLSDTQLKADGALPGTLNHFQLRFRIRS